MALPLIPIAIGGGGLLAGFLGGRASKDAEASVTDTLTSFGNISKIAVLMIAVGAVYYITKKKG